MKKIFIFIIPIFVIFLTGCISINQNNLEDNTNKIIEVGESFAISSGKNAKYESTDELIASVSSDGIVTGIGVGSCNIKIETESKAYNIVITVTDNKNEVYLKIDGKQTLTIDEEETLKPSVYNSNDNFVYTFESLDPSIVTVSDKGVAKGVSSGVAIIRINATGLITLTKDFLIYVKSESSTEQLNIIESKIQEMNGSFDLTYLNELVKGVVNSNKDSIVGVSNYQYQQTFYERKLVEASVGTGFIFKKEAISNGYKYYCLTNHHVVEKAVKLKVYFGYIDEYVDCELVNSNSDLDIAVVTFNLDRDLKVLELGDIDDVSVGDFAIAIGNANGYEFFGSVTFGIISFVNRSLSGETAKFLQHDVAINPGNSGGPLFNLEGKVIGINTLKIVDTDVDNMGFSISIDTVKEYLKILKLL